MPRQPIVATAVDTGLVGARLHRAEGDTGARQAARGRALQSTVHSQQRDVRETAPCAGPDAAHMPRRRCGHRVRTSIDDAPAAPGRDQTRARVATSATAGHDVWLATNPVSGATRCLDARRRQCAFIGARGRCTERGFLEFHHVIPFADGGLAVVDNIQLRCRAHNQYELDRWFGTQDPPVVRERRDFSGWSNSVRTESPVMSDRRRPMTAVGDKKCQNFSLATVMSRLASAGCLSVTDRLGAHSRSVTACAAH